jgi:hypothetical protein
MAIANLAPQALLRSDNDTRRQRRMRCRAKTGLAAALPRTRSLVIGQLLLEVFVFPAADSLCGVYDAAVCN